MNMSADLNVMSASDEEILKLTAPPASPAEPVEKKPEEAPAPAPEVVEVPPEQAPGETAPEGQEKPQEAPGAAAVPTPAPEASASQAAPEQAPEGGEERADGDLVKYRSFYDRVMGPIKAGGKTIKLESEDEVVSLLQKGLDYTRKTMELSKYRRFGMMLENAGLLDDGKLDHLIAVHNKDPEAIKKFFKDNKLDPVDIDTSTGDNFKPGAHAVTDEHAKFQEAVDDIQSLDGGQETLSTVKAWDQASKQELWKQPQLLAAIHQQRVGGVYAKISAEVDRLQTLGKIPSGTPFLYAYKTVGDSLQSQGKLGGGTSAAPKTPAPAGGTAPVTRRPASTSTTSAPGKSAAKAAAPTKTTPGSGNVVPNFMAMSDEDFLKAKI